MRIAVAAAEPAHLVFSTLHTVDVASTISRISDSFPLERQNLIRPGISHGSRRCAHANPAPQKRRRPHPAAELLVVGYGARHHVRKTLSITTTHTLHRNSPHKKKGSFSPSKESLVHLITPIKSIAEDAQLCSIHPDDLDILLKSSSASA